jgi:hypothetical protein
MNTTALRHPARYVAAATTGDAARPWAVLRPLDLGGPMFRTHHATQANARAAAARANLETGRA